MGSNFRITGVEALQDVLKNSAKAQDEIREIIRDTTSDILADSQKNLAPHYKTGRLSLSGSMSVRADLGEVGYNTHYAPHLEYGHRTRSGGFVKGVKYLEKAVEDNREAHNKAISEMVRKITGN